VPLCLVLTKSCNTKANNTNVLHFHILHPKSLKDHNLVISPIVKYILNHIVLVSWGAWYKPGVSKCLKRAFQTCMRKLLQSSILKQTWCRSVCSSQTFADCGQGNRGRARVYSFGGKMGGRSSASSYINCCFCLTLHFNGPILKLNSRFKYTCWLCILLHHLLT
jgi:hypothetical protein